MHKDSSKVSVTADISFRTVVHCEIQERLKLQL